jgi:NAD-dependent SIR2 family protein deacetylase
MAWMISSWAQTVGAMRDHGATVSAHCSRCGGDWPVDAAKLAELKGDAYSLVGRRTRCRQCGGWVKFHVLHGVMRPLWTDADIARWMRSEASQRP